MIFEKIKVKDVEEVHQLGSKVKEFETNKEVVSFWPVSILKKIIKSKDAICIKCSENNKIIGFIIVSYVKGFSKATIENIYVKEDYRKNGIGRKLVAESVEMLKKKGCSYLISWTNDAVEEFLFWGFSMGEDFSWMSLCLDDSFKK